MQKEVIQEFSILKDKSTVQSFYEQMLDFIVMSLNRMNANSNEINRLDPEYAKIFPIGEYTNDTYIDDNGELEIVIASSDPQLVSLNNSFAKYIKNSKKKEKDNLINDGTFDKIIPTFAEYLASNFSEKTPILLVNEGIKIISKEEFSHKVLIRFATFNENDENCILNFWQCLSQNYVYANLFDYVEKIDQKDNDTNGKYKKIIRIYKNIRKNILINRLAKNSDISKYLVELMMYNIPNSLYDFEDIYEVFVSTLNYLTNANIYNFKDFDGNPIIKFAMAKSSYCDIKHFIDLIIKIASE